MLVYPSVSSGLIYLQGILLIYKLVSNTVIQICCQDSILSDYFLPSASLVLFIKFCMISHYFNGSYKCMKTKIF